MEMSKIEKIRFRWRVYFYGEYIVEAMMLDNILKELKLRGVLQFNQESPPDKTDKDINQNLDYLTAEGYITALMDNAYDITQKGKLLLANGGFTTEAKKNKNALFAFGISIIALTIALLSFLSGIFHWFRPFS